MRKQCWLIYSPDPRRRPQSSIGWKRIEWRSRVSVSCTHSLFVAHLDGGNVLGIDLVNFLLTQREAAMEGEEVRSHCEGGPRGIARCGFLVVVPAILTPEDDQCNYY